MRSPDPRLPCIAGLALIALLPTAALAARPVEAPRYRDGEVLVRYHDPAQASALKARLGLVTEKRLSTGRVELLRLPAITDTTQALALLRADPAVALAEPNFLRRPLETVPNDPLFGEQWGLRSTGQLNFATSDPALASIPGADMDLARAWDADNDGVADRVGDGSMKVAILDTAFEVAHEDLAANFIPGRDTARGDNNVGPDAAGMQTHGTLVAGALGAVGNNGIGVAGVVWNVDLLPIKISRIVDGVEELDNAAILAGYEHAAAQGARVINASYGGADFSQLELDAIRELADADILLVASAGNDDSNTDDAVAIYPANYDADNVVAVAATNRQDNVASFSQYGPISVDLGAPGLQIVTTDSGNSYNFSAGNRASSGVSGTSFSAPYVAGIAALLRMEFPAAGFREIKARLIEGAERVGSEGAVATLTAAGRANAADSLDLSPRPSVVIHSRRLLDDNQRLDPGETVELELTLDNLWLTATGLQAQLVSGDPAVSVQAPTSHTLATLAGNGGRATVRYGLQVGAAPAAYRRIPLTLILNTPAGYQAQRSLLLELARLDNGTPVTARLSTGLYDDFHTYHFRLDSLPAGHDRLLLRSRAGNGVDIDLLVKRGSAPQYLITLRADAEEQVFFSNADAVGGDEDGNEDVCIRQPTLGTYYVTVVNYSALENTDYSLEAVTQGGSLACAASSVSGGGGGGAPAPAGLLLLLSAALLRSLQGYRRTPLPGCKKA
ncbi:MAG TPA: S8 family serine peptidase [Solimonas sp.]|nr:S8 family serine peptidase [Solimonas sp.]